MVCACTCKLAPSKLACAFGIIWGLGILGIGWCGAAFGYGLSFISTFGSVYLGFAPTFIGGIIGLVWALIDGYLTGWLIAAVYNYCLGKPAGCCGKGKK